MAEPALAEPTLTSLGRGGGSGLSLLFFFPFFFFFLISPPPPPWDMTSTAIFFSSSLKSSLAKLLMSSSSVLVRPVFPLLFPPPLPPPSILCVFIRSSHSLLIPSLTIPSFQCLLSLSILLPFPPSTAFLFLACASESGDERSEQVSGERSE